MLNQDIYDAADDYAFFSEQKDCNRMGYCNSYSRLQVLTQIEIINNIWSIRYMKILALDCDSESKNELIF